MITVAKLEINKFENSIYFFRCLEIHKTCFITFVATSECYMCMTYFLNKNSLRNSGKLSRVQEKSLTWKRNLFITNVSSFCLAGYCFVRHNSKCEPYGEPLYFFMVYAKIIPIFSPFLLVYTFFAFFEYVVVLTNMGFHLTSWYDFIDKWLVLDASKGLYFTSAYSTLI